MRRSSVRRMPALISGWRRRISSSTAMAPNAGSRLQDWHDLAVPNLGQWVRTPAASRRFLLRWQPRIILDAVAGCPAETGFGGSNGGIFAMSVNHVQPHLVVGDVKAGQSLIPQFRDESDT